LYKKVAMCLTGTTRPRGPIFPATPLDPWPAKQQSHYCDKLRLYSVWSSCWRNSSHVSCIIFLPRRLLWERTDHQRNVFP